MGGSFVATAYRCPADDIESHPVVPGMPGDANDKYRFSYTINEMMCNHFARETPPTNGRAILTRSKIRHPSQKMLVIDESSQTIDDGDWAPYAGATFAANLLSNRHDRQSEAITDLNAGWGTRRLWMAMRTVCRGLIRCSGSFLIRWRKTRCR